MSATQPAMSSGRLWGLAEKAVKATRLVGRDGRIGALPFPASMWTGARDLPEAPAENFREWWARTHPTAPHSGPAHSGPARPSREEER